MAKPKKNNLTAEKTAPKRAGNTYSVLSASYDPLGNDDPVLNNSMGQWTGTPDQRRMIENDSQVKACMTVRRNALLGTPADICASDGFEVSDDVIDDCRVALRRIANFRDVIGGMLSASVPYGHSIAEVVWVQDPATGRLYPDGIKVRSQGAMWVDCDNNIMAKDDNGVPVVLDEQGEYAQKLLVMTHDSADGTRKGCGLAASLWYPVWGKAENTKAWLIHNDKHGMPILEGVVADGTNDADMIAFKRVLTRAVNQSVLVHHEKHQIKFLDSNNFQATDTFQTFTTHLENQIAKLILGQTMTTGDINSGGSGSYAIGKVGQDVFESIVKADAVMVESVVTQLLRWFVALNYGDGPAAGIEYKFQFETVDLTADEFANVMQKMASAGMKLDVDGDWLRMKLGTPEPREDGEAVTIGTAGVSPGGAIPPDDGGGGFRQFSDAPAPKYPDVLPVHLQRHADARAKASKPLAESVYSQMTEVLEMPGTDAEKARRIMEFTIKPTQQARGLAREIGAAVFVGIALGSTTPALAKDKRHRYDDRMATDGAVNSAVDIALEAESAGLLLMTSGDFVAPVDAIKYIQSSAVKPSMRLNSYIASSNTWGAASVVNQQYAAQETVKILLGKQIGVEGITDASEVQDALGRVDYRQFLKDWNEVGLPGLVDYQTQLIFNQNIQTAFSAGRWVGLDSDVHREQVAGLRYVSMLLPTTRQEHRQWHGTIHPIDSEFWDSHYPPNGFNCLCDVIAVYTWDKAEVDAARKSGKFYQTAPNVQLPVYTTKAGVTYDFNYNPGRQLQRGQITGLAT